ncbi:MAG: hypothetical protein ACLQU4_03710 [Limisphaerales bacterium]
MKTPREILLQRHEAVELKLDAVRRNALAALERPGLAQSCRQFIFSMRWHLAGLSAVWMAVLLLNFDSVPNPTVFIAQDKIPTARVLLEALLKNRRELMELTASPAAGEPAALPPRRSEVQSAIEIV